MLTKILKALGFGYLFITSPVLAALRRPNVELDMPAQGLSPINHAHQDSQDVVFTTMTDKQKNDHTSAQQEIFSLLFNNPIDDQDVLIKIEQLLDYNQNIALAFQNNYESINSLIEKHLVDENTDLSQIVLMQYAEFIIQQKKPDYKRKIEYKLTEEQFALGVEQAELSPEYLIKIIDHTNIPEYERELYIDYLVKILTKNLLNQKTFTLDQIENISSVHSPYRAELMSRTYRNIFHHQINEIIMRYAQKNDYISAMKFSIDKMYEKQDKFPLDIEELITYSQKISDNVFYQNMITILYHIAKDGLLNGFEKNFQFNIGEESSMYEAYKSNADLRRIIKAFRNQYILKSPVLFKAYISKINETQTREDYQDLVNLLSSISPSDIPANLIDTALINGLIQYGVLLLKENTDHNIDKIFLPIMSYEDLIIFEGKAPEHKNHLFELSKNTSTPDIIKNAIDNFNHMERYLEDLAKETVDSFFMQIIRSNSNLNYIKLFEQIEAYFSHIPPDSKAGELSHHQRIETAKTLTLINSTKPFIKRNFTQSLWNMFEQHEQLLVKDPKVYELYQQQKKTLIDFIYSIPSIQESKNRPWKKLTLGDWVVLSIVVFIFWYIVVSRYYKDTKTENPLIISNRNKKITHKHLNAEHDSTSINTLPQTPAPDPFPASWEIFKYKINSADKKILELDQRLSDYKNKVSASSTGWHTKNLDTQLVDFIQTNLDYFAIHIDSIRFINELSKEFVNKIIWIRLIHDIQAKGLDLEHKKRLDDFKKLIDIKLPEKCDPKSYHGFKEGKNFINSNTPQKSDFYSPHNNGRILTLMNQLKHQSKLTGPGIDYILDSLTMIHTRLKDEEKVSPVSATVISDNIIKTDIEVDPIVPNFELWTFQAPSKEMPCKPSTALNIENKKPINNIISVTINQPYMAFATKLDEYLNVVFYDNYIALTNRALKILIIQYHSLLTQEHLLLENIRDRFCHRWDSIGKTKDLRVILFHIVRLMALTRDGSLSSINSLNKELSLYEEHISQLTGDATPTGSGAEVTKRKILALLKEYDETTIICSDRNLGELAKLACYDILFQIGEILGHSKERKDHMKWVTIRNNGYHKAKPNQTELIDEAMTELLPLLKIEYGYSGPAPDTTNKRNRDQFTI